MKKLKEIKQDIARLIDYNRDEKKDWEQCAAYGRGPNFELSGYDSTLCPGHIYHTILKLQKFVESGS